MASDSGDSLFVSPGHFYSPVVSREEAASHFDRVQLRQATAMCDVKLMEDLWYQTVDKMIMIQQVIENGSFGEMYKFGNGFFDYGDALVYSAMVNRFRPSRIVEIGSGHSSALLLETLKYFDMTTRVTFIEPYPAIFESLIKLSDFPYARLLEKKVQDVDLTYFTDLVEGDILFIDSSHVVKTGSDVYYEIFEILPRLKPGVVIHFHDIFDGFEYPTNWAIAENRSWNESYFLRLLLTPPSDYLVLFFNAFFANSRPDIVNNSECLFKKNPGGSLWVRRF